MTRNLRSGLALLLTLTALLISRHPLAQGGNAPHIYLADGAWDSEDCRLIRVDDLTGKGWSTFGSKGKADKQFGSVTGVMEVRDPSWEGYPGRDHHPNAFTMWLAGGGVKGGVTYGETDDLGYHIAKDGVHIHDLQATIMQLIGIDHTRLTYRFQGRNFRLTDVSREVVRGILT
ncbi:MAG: hypothetical protein JWN14_3952 [Chthonomonadales bacterium]|nr:hypothetical protein [Chthonomonadales bacterium]